MRARALPMSRAAVHPAVRPERRSAVDMAVSVDPGPAVKCSLQCVPNAVLRPRYPSNPVKAELYTAAVATTGSNPAIAGN